MTKAIGLQGYKGIIAFGTVEDCDDPEQLCRIKVRIPQHGSKGQTPTEALPWARTTIPSQGVGPNQGGGGSQGGLSVAKNATVMVMLNEDNHEDITVLGVLPTNSTGNPGQHAGASAGGQSTVAYGGLKDGTSGGKFEPATDMSKKVLSSAPPAFPQQKGKYPDTHVNVSKSGFRTTFHDIGGETYKAEIHPTGTFTEMQADGNFVCYTTNNRKEAVDGEYTLGSEKSMVITTNGDLQLKVKGNMLVEVQGTYVEYVAGKRRMLSGENIDVGAKGQVDIIGEKAAGIESPGTTFVTGVGGVQLNKSSRKSAVPGISSSNPSASEIKSNIESGKYAKALSSK